MTMDQTSDSRAPKPNPFARIIGALFSPFETMPDVARRPGWLVPMLFIIALSVGTGLLTMSHFDMETEARAEMVKRGVPEQQIERQVAAIAKFQQFWVPFTAAFIPLMLLIIAGVVFLVFKVMGGEGTFKQAFSVTTYAWMPMLVKGLIATGLIMQRVSVTPNELLVLVRSNLGFLAHPQEQPVLFATLTALDLFTIWTVLLLGIGFSALSRFSLAKSITMVTITWLMVVAFRVGIAAVFS